MIAYITVLWAASLMFAYTLVFSRATLIIGKSISYSDSPTGFQDAITPPWSTKFTILAYAISIGVIGYGWYEYGWLAGLGISCGFCILLVPLSFFILPKSNSEHFRRLIIHSLMNRYADFAKSGDEMRAAATASLLERLGMTIPDFNKR